MTDPAKPAIPELPYRVMESAVGLLGVARALNDQGDFEQGAKCSEASLLMQKLVQHKQTDHARYLAGWRDAMQAAAGVCESDGFYGSTVPVAIAAAIRSLPEPTKDDAK